MSPLVCPYHAAQHGSHAAHAAHAAVCSTSITHRVDPQCTIPFLGVCLAATVRIQHGKPKLCESVGDDVARFWTSTEQHNAPIQEVEPFLHTEKCPAEQQSIQSCEVC